MGWDIIPMGWDSKFENRKKKGRKYSTAYQLANQNMKITIYCLYYVHYVPTKSGDSIQKKKKKKGRGKKTLSSWPSGRRAVLTRPTIDGRLILSDPEIITDFAQNGAVTGAVAPPAQDHRSFRHQSWQDVPNLPQAPCSSSIAAGSSGWPSCWGPPGGGGCTLKFLPPPILARLCTVVPSGRVGSQHVGAQHARCTLLVPQGLFGRLVGLSRTVGMSSDPSSGTTTELVLVKATA